ncbi:MAG: SdiA-regulated domain-containing protein [Planctomycetes bacterium]|nr:SdiA-regulated domain-containing protein [Planctomycetota bacterium]
MSGYEEHYPNTNLSGTNDDDFSGVVYHEPTQSFFIIDNGANADNGAIHEYRYEEVVVGPDTLLQLVHQRVIDFKNFDTDPNDGIKPGDPEGITWMGGDKFAFVRERSGFIHEFWIDVDGPVDADSDVDGDLAGAPVDTTEEIDKNGGSITTITPNPDPSRDNNQGLEGIAYDSDRDVFYVVKEKDWLDLDGQNGTEIIYEVATNGTVTPVHVAGLTSELSGRDVSDVYYANDHIFIITEQGLNQITRITWNAANSAWEFDTNDDDDILDGADIPAGQPEAITFSSDGFDMFVVGEPRQFFHYRNYTSFTPNAAPDMTDASDTRVDGDNITTDTTPTFTGTLTRTVGGNSIPLDGATVFLYVDGVEKGTDETDANGFYSVTPTAALSAGSGQIVTIKVGEETSSIEANQSIASTSVSITIALTDSIADLNIDGFVDFDDLTILLANWNQNVSAAEGNLVDPSGSVVDFADLTVLLAAWTGPGGPGGAGSPEATSVWPDEGDTAYSASIDVYVVFSEEVQGVDASDLELFGLGGIEATIGTPTHIINNVWKFPVSGLLPGAVDVVLAIDEDDITDMAGNSIAPKAWSFVVDPGLWLNEDGTGDVALAADFLGLSSTAVTVEVTFVSDEITSGIGAGTPIFAYATDDEQDAFTLFIENDAPNNMKLYVNGASVVLASGTDVTDLFDGVKYHLAVTYDSDTGKARAYVDGVAIGTEQTFGTPTTVDDGSDNKGGTFFLGQEPDSEWAPTFGFDTEQIFQGSILEVRIYDEVRTPLSRSNSALFALSA